MPNPARYINCDHDFNSVSGPINLKTPSASGDAASKGYVDALVGGGAGAGSFATLAVTSINAATVPVTFTGASSQSADLVQNKNSGGTVLSGFDSSGRLFIGPSGTRGTITGSFASDKTITIPDATDTLVGKATTDALTNKTISGATNVIAPTDANFTITGSADLTKVARFEVDGLTTATTRVFTLPDANIVVSGSAAALTSARVPFATTGGLLTDSANFLWDSSLSKLTINSIGLSRGAGNVAGNTALGNAAIAGAGAPGTYNTALGFEALKLAQDLGGGALQGSQGNTAIGAQAMSGAIVVGEYNIALGYLSLYSATSAYCNVAVGIRALEDCATGLYNTAIGTDALKDSTVSNNTAVGAKALLVNTTGTPNVALGVSSLYANTTGSNNVALGANSLEANISGNQNVAVGNDALKLVTATGNIALGYAAGDNLTTGSRNIVIGYNIDAASATASDTLNIGNLIFATGVSGTGTTLSTGNVGIGTSAPQAKLDVRGLMWVRQADGSYLSFTSDTTQATIDYSNTTGFRYTFNGSTTTFVIDSSSRVGIGGVTPGTYNTQMAVTNLAASRIGQVIRLAASQTAYAFEIQNSAGAQRFTVLASGGFEIRNDTAAAVVGMLRAATSQTADIFALQNSGGVVLTAFNASGAFGAFAGFADGVNIALGTTTGTKIGTSTSQKIGFFNSTPIVQPSAYTQTYSTADKTHANFTSADISAFTGGSVGFLDAAERDNIRTQYNALRADVADLKQLVNSVIDDLQALGLVA